MIGQTEYRKPPPASAVTTLCFVMLFLCGCIAPPGPDEVLPLHCPEGPLLYTGEATFYTFADGRGSCSFDASPNDMMIGAMNQQDYNGSQACGACVRITGPNGTVTVRIVDLCPECPAGDIDLSPQAFSRIADTSLGRVPIRWEFTECSVSGPITYHIGDSSNQWWSSVQVRNHRYPVFSLEYLTKGGWYRMMRRSTYNYFLEPGGIGDGQVILRVTDIYGHVLTDSGVVFLPGATQEGARQFPVCDDGGP